MSDADDNVIRHQAPHQVTMKDGSNVAAGKKADAIEPSVRKVLADEEGLTIQHELSDHRVAAPAGAAQAESDELPSFKREANQDMALAPVFKKQSLDDADGPLIPRVTGDHRELLPESFVAAADDGPLIKRVENDHRVALPSDTSRLAERPIDTVLGQTEAPAARVEPAATAPAPTEETAAALPEAEMPRMDFPARVVKIKIENDKVRQKLDALDAKDPVRH